MAWTNPRTWVLGEVVTAALLNTHVRDNLNYLKTNPVIAETSTTTNTFQANNTTATILTLSSVAIPSDYGAVYVEAWARGFGYSNPPGSGSNMAYNCFVEDSVAGIVANAGFNISNDIGQTTTGTTDFNQLTSMYIRSVDLAWASTTRFLTLKITGGSCIAQIVGGVGSPIVLRVVRSY